MLFARSLARRVAVSTHCAAEQLMAWRLSLSWAAALLLCLLSPAEQPVLSLQITGSTRNRVGSVFITGDVLAAVAKESLY